MTNIHQIYGMFGYDNLDLAAMAIALEGEDSVQCSVPVDGSN